MKKQNIRILLVYLPLILSFMGLGFLFSPILTIEGSVINIIQFLTMSSVILSLRLFFIIGLGLSFLAGTLLIFKKQTLTSVALVLFILVGTFYLLMPSMIETTDASLTVTLHAGMVINIGIMFLNLIVALRLFFDDVKLTVKEMVELGILVALAIVFDFIPKIKVGATGGSISLTMLPLFIIAFRFSFVKTFLASGIIYGLLTCLFDGYGFATYPFDYLLGFGLISLTSLFRHLAFSRKQPLYLSMIYFAIAIIVGGFARFIGATMSSMIIYETTLWGGLTYNATYIIPSVGFSLLILLLFYSLLANLNKRYPIHD